MFSANRNAFFRFLLAATQLEDTDENDLVYYVLLRAVDRFRTEYSKFPGYYRDSMEADIPKLKVPLAQYCRWYASQMEVLTLSTCVSLPLKWGC